VKVDFEAFSCQVPTIASDPPATAVAVMLTAARKATIEGTSSFLIFVSPSLMMLSRPGAVIIPTGGREHARAWVMSARTWLSAS